jgi:hypothetical protein
MKASSVGVTTSSLHTSKETFTYPWTDAPAVTNLYGKNN